MPGDTFEVVVAGSRGFKNYELMCTKLDRMLSRVTKQIVIISGGARGADKMGERYAKDRGYKCKVMPADWDRYGRGAGYRRNRDMAKIGDAVVCFWDGVSPGTKSMIDLGNEYNRQVRTIIYDRRL